MILSTIVIVLAVALVAALVAWCMLDSLRLSLRWWLEVPGAVPSRNEWAQLLSALIVAGWIFLLFVWWG